MKKILSIFYLGVLLLILNGCEDNRMNWMVDDKVYFINNDFQKEAIFNTGSATYRAAIYKSGVGQQPAEVSIVVDESLLSTYNEENGTQYKALPSAMYTMPATCSLSKDEERTYLEIKFDTQKIIDLQGEEVSEYVLPIRLKSENGIAIDETKSVLLLAPVVDQPCLIFDPFGNNTVKKTVTADGLDDVVLTTTVKTNYENEDDLTFTVEVDPSLASTGVAPSDSYILHAEEFSLPAGTNSKELSITIKRNAFVDKDGNWKFGDYVLPLRITSVSKYYTDETESVQFFKFEVVAKELSRTNWFIIDWNSCICEEPNYADLGRTPEKMLDGDESTFWGSKWDAPKPLPYYFIFDMQEEFTLFRLAIVKPNTDAWRGLMKNGYFETSSDNVTWTRLSDWVMESNDPRTHLYDIPATKARYIRLVITDAFEYADPNLGPAGGARLDIAEFKAWGM